MQREHNSILLCMLTWYNLYQHSTWYFSKCEFFSVAIEKHLAAEGFHIQTEADDLLDDLERSPTRASRYTTKSRVSYHLADNHDSNKPVTPAYSVTSGSNFNDSWSSHYSYHRDSTIVVHSMQYEQHMDYCSLPAEKLSRQARITASNSCSMMLILNPNKSGTINEQTSFIQR